jgi:UDP-glucose 4-epimerase
LEQFVPNESGVCCVVGGTGFIGTAVVTCLLETGRDVLIIGRRPAPQRLEKGVKYIQADITDRSLLRSVFSVASEVIDLAYGSVPKTSFDDPVSDILINLPPTVSMLEELANSSVSKFVYVSSGGTVYGEAVEVPITESHATRPISPYGVTKLASERYVDLYCISRGIPAVIARPANAYGEMQSGKFGQGFIAAAIQALLMNKAITVYGARGTVRDYVHVNDVATALVAALDHGVPRETYNIGTGVGTDNLDILETLDEYARAFGYQPPMVDSLPARTFDVSINVLDASKLNAVSGWKPSISLRDGLSRCWNYAMEHAAR